MRQRLHSPRTLALAAACLLASQSAAAAWLSHPLVTVSGSCASTLQLNMELNGYNNYGSTDGRSDVLYSGESGTWTFKDPCAHTTKAYLLLAVALDDHYPIPIGNYEIEIKVNGKTVTAGQADDLGMRHGTPFGEKFDNWQYLNIPIEPSSQYQVDVSNRSGLPKNEWLAIDHISLHLSE